MCMWRNRPDHITATMLMPQSKTFDARTMLAVACVLIIATYTLLIDLKGVSTDEGIRLAIINGGEAFGLNEPSSHASWAKVLETNAPYAYQPLYFLIQNTLMSVAKTH